MKRIDESYYYNDDTNIRDEDVLNLTLDETVYILSQLKAFDISLYKEIIELNPEKDDIPLTLKANLGMVVLNNKISNQIYKRIDDIIQESSYYQTLHVLNIQSQIFEAIVDGMYQEAKEQFENEQKEFEI